MDFDHAVAELNKFPRLHQTEGSTGDEWARREPFIHIIEDAVSDRSYVTERNSFISAASSYADIHTMKMRDGSYHSRDWTLNFLGRMDQLWAASQQPVDFSRLMR